MTEIMLLEASSGALRENIDHTIGDSLKLLENLIAVTNMYRAKYENASRRTFSKFKVVGIQAVRTTITLVTVSLSQDGLWLYEEPRRSPIPANFAGRFDCLSMFELLAYLQDVCQQQNKVISQLNQEQAGTWASMVMIPYCSVAMAWALWSITGVDRVVLYCHIEDRSLGATLPCL